jgi:predicted lipoprotein with Yx(FWY)xxD motif
MPTHRFPLPRRSRLARLYSTAATLTVSSALLLGPGATLARADRPAPPQKTDPARAVLGTEQTAYGTVLDIGAGAGYAPGSSTATFPPGSAVYMATIDPLVNGDGNGYRPGCTTTLVNGPLPGGQFAGGISGPLSCTGPETDAQADWQALTTDRRPIAGPGVDPSMLGQFLRPDLRTFQVTYAGHPLYLFVPGPSNAAFGADFFESTLPLPPWHTAWYLLSPDGQPATGPATLETETLPSGQTVLANQMLPAIGGAPIAVYTFSNDRGPRSTCYRACAREFIPVLTNGMPIAGAGASADAIGTTVRANGTQQVTYAGHPLYIYSAEQFTSLTGTAGNGNGVEVNGGTLSLVTP